ncbi:MAG: divalent-cation tolerance protein CutA [Actinomycetota bacterium]
MRPHAVNASPSFGAQHGESVANEDRVVLIYTTLPTLDAAKRLGEALVAAKLAACVNMFPGMISIFEWKGVREEADEVAMIIKSREGLVDQVLMETKRLHPYELPALLVIPTEGGNAEYCDWIVSETGGGGGR